MKMNKTQKAYRKKILDYSKYQMELMVKLRAKSVPPLSLIPDDFEFYFDGGTSEAMTIGFSPDNIRLFWNLMNDAGWKNVNTSAEIIAEMKSNAASNKYTRWSHGDGVDRVSFGVWVVIGSTGSNCQRVEVGTEMVETPIYEILCDDALAELEAEKAAAAAKLETDGDQ